jgi:hypothetical protein
MKKRDDTELTPEVAPEGSEYPVVDEGPEAEGEEPEAIPLGPETGTIIIQGID